MSDVFSFSSDGLDPDEVFRRYAELYGIGTDVGRGSGAFRARVRAWRLQGLIIYDRDLSGVIHSRADRIAGDGFDHFVVSLVLKGRVTGGPASGFEVAEAGDVFIADTLRATRTEAHDARMITVSLARPAVEAALGSTTGLHGRLLRPPRNLMLADYLVSLTRRADDLDDSALPGLGRALIEILGSVPGVRARPGSEAHRLAFSRRELVEQHIDAQIADPQLSVEAISAATGISRSTLYRLFDQRGGVGRLIQRRRPTALRAALDDRDPAPAEALALRFGFAGPARMERLFRESFGLGIADYRRAVEAVEPGAPRDSRRRWQTWLSEIT